MKENEDRDEGIPEWFAKTFRALVLVIQPRGLKPDTMAAYWTVLHLLPMWAVERSGAELQDSRFFPNAGDWFHAAKALAATWTPPAPGSRRLEELDGLHPNDPERDEICKGLSDEDGDRLMARAGYVKDGRNWRHTDDLP